MTLAQGFVVLSSQDADAPFCPAVGTCSKEDASDDGGFVIGQQAAENGAVWIDRAYWQGNPDPAWLAGQCDDALEAGAAWAQCGNELNLYDVEHFEGGPEAYFALEDAVRSLVVDPARILAMPPSPGVPGWEQWVRSAGDHAVHAYGGFADMKAIVEWYLANTSGRVVITECNWGAGNAVDVDQWAGAELVPFLDWCNTQPRVVSCLYFAYRWRGAPPMPTPVDAAGTAVERVVTDWVPPMNGGAGDITLSVPMENWPASPANYEPGPRPVTRGVVIHCTRGGAASPQDEYVGTTLWFQNPQAGVSAHLVVGPDAVARCVPDDATAWHARTANDDHLGIEVCQARDGDPITDFQYQAAAEACRLWAQKYGFPLARVMGEAAPGLVGHEDTESGQADGKSDPGYAWDWPRFVWYCTEGTAAPDPIVAVQDQLWALAEQAESLGHPWLGQGVKSVVALAKGEA